MRKLFVLLILMVAIGINAQTYFVECQLAEWTDQGSWDGVESFEVSDVMLTMNKDASTIVIDNKDHDKFVYDNQVQDSIVDVEGYKVQFRMWDAYDKKGESCIIVLSYFDDEDISYAGKYSLKFRFIYDDGPWFGYYGNVVNVLD